MRRTSRTARFLPIPLIALATLGVLASPASAQTVVGTVTERGTARPVAGAFVVLVDEAGRRGNGVLSGPTGAFVLQAREPGRYRLLAELIGYGTTTSGWVELAAAGSVRQDLEIAVEAVSLDGIQVETGQRCRRRPGSGPATARLWEEARKALEVARWSEGQGVLRFSVVRHRRELDARTLRVTAQKEIGTEGLYDRSPYRSIPADRLASGGYVQAAADGTYDYFAPDAEVLLSESFLETHCFRVEGAPKEEPELIGLAFEPVPERELPDISGVLWLDRGSAELRRLDYRYLALPFRHGSWPTVGGRVEFERLATGMWIVRRWHVRMPLAATEIGGFGGDARQLELLSLTEDGAEVRSVRTRDGTRVSEALGATLHGVIRGGPEGSGAPLEDARVELVGTPHQATTSAEGAFRIAGLPSGSYAVRVTHPALERLGVEPLERDVRLESGRATRLAETIALTPELARDLCTRGGWAGRGGAPVLVHGTVVSPDGGTPVPGAVLRVWSDGPERRIATDTAGAFVFCLDPSAAPVRVAAVEPAVVVASAAALDPVEIAVSEAGFVEARLTVSRPRRVSTTPEAARRAGWSNAIMGRVLEEGTQRPVEGAMVALIGPAGVDASMVTDAAGRFRLLHPKEGDRFTLRVEHIAYGASESQVEFAADEEIRMDVLVSARPIDLEPIVVTGRRLDFLAAEGFYERLERGAGFYVQREEIERRRPAKITDVLHGRPGLTVVGKGSEFDVRILQRISIQVGPGSCQPSVWIDGRKVRGGGPARDGDMLLSQLIDPEQVEAMEVYTGPAGLPIQFGGPDAACGVVVLWTRRG